MEREIRNLNKIVVDSHQANGFYKKFREFYLKKLNNQLESMDVELVVFDETESF